MPFHSHFATLNFPTLEAAGKNVEILSNAAGPCIAKTARDEVMS